MRLKTIRLVAFLFLLGGWNQAAFGQDAEKAAHPLIVAPSAGDPSVTQHPVPFRLGGWKTLVDTSAASAGPHEVQIADVAVRKQEDRSLRLRVTLGGAPHPTATPSTAAPFGPALVTAHLRLAVVPTIER